MANDTIKINLSTSGGANTQTVNFINLYNFSDSPIESKKDSYNTSNKISDPTDFISVLTDEQLAILIDYPVVNNEEVAEIKEFTKTGVAKFKNVSGNSQLFRKEVIGDIEYNLDGSVNFEELVTTPLELAAQNISTFNLQDYNISNNRTYVYVLYPYDGSFENVNSQVIEQKQLLIKTNWSGWSITELHPTDNPSIYEASPQDVWIFNCNVSTGEQTQNINRNEQQTLGQFSRFAQGPTNYVTGNVSCLLGRDVTRKGYNETHPNLDSNNKTSNSRVDMLRAWRAMVKSSNPKLLKDRAGQKFLVTLTSSTNAPNDAVRIQPNTISFSWTQIGSADNIQVRNFEVDTNN